MAGGSNGQARVDSIVGFLIGIKDAPNSFLIFLIALAVIVGGGYVVHGPFTTLLQSVEQIRQDVSEGNGRLGRVEESATALRREMSSMRDGLAAVADEQSRVQRELSENASDRWSFADQRRWAQLWRVWRDELVRLNMLDVPPTPDADQARQGD